MCLQVIELGQHMHEGTSEQHVYALVGPGEAPAVHLLPETPQTEALLNASASPLHFWRCNATTGTLLDWWLSHMAAVSHPDSAQAVMRQAVPCTLVAQVMYGTAGLGGLPTCTGIRSPDTGLVTTIAASSRSPSLAISNTFCKARMRHGLWIYKNSQKSCKHMRLQRRETHACMHAVQVW